MTEKQNKNAVLELITDLLKGAVNLCSFIGFLFFIALVILRIDGAAFYVTTSKELKETLNKVWDENYKKCDLTLFRYFRLSGNCCQPSLFDFEDAIPQPQEGNLFNSMNINYAKEFQFIRGGYPEELTEDQINELLSKYDETQDLPDWPFSWYGIMLNKSETKLFYKAWFKHLKWSISSDTSFCERESIGSLIYADLKFIIEEPNEDYHEFCEEIFEDFLDFWKGTKLFHVHKFGVLRNLNIGGRVRIPNYSFYNSGFSGKLRKRLLEFVLKTD